MAAEQSALDTRAEADKTPAKKLARWLLEIKLAKKREKDWRTIAKEVLDKYRGKNRKKSSFNILWSNTEVLRPALYNSPPKPDVRRRFRQSDLLGKAVSELMERSISYCADAYDLDQCVKGDVLDGLLPGRGLSRVRYVPKFKQIPKGTQEASQSQAGQQPAQPDGADGGEAFGGDREEVEYEQALCEHVQWDDFLHGPGKTWEEVTWVAFRHTPNRDDLIEQFGEQIGKAITLNDTADDDVQDKKNAKDVADVFKRAELWEIWDKEGNEVFFVCDSYKTSVIYALVEEGVTAKQGEPPLKLRNFFPIPRPLMLVEDTGTLIPSPLYELYREQADELNVLSYRITKVVRALKIRGVYDATLGELSELMKGEDNTLVPAERASAYMTNGGLEKAIWWMPVEQAAVVLKELYVARDAAKQVIYELTGIADIIRGASDPDETLGAQKIKANSAGLRLQRMQREVQRYVRDLIRLLAEVIGENFDQTTLAQMTGMNFPTNQQKQMIQLQMHAMQQQAQQAAQANPGQPPAPPPPQLQAMQNTLQMPSWEDIMAVLKSDIQREYRVDVETDSTVAEVLRQDMTGMKEVLTGVVEFWQGVGPAVQAGAVTMEAVKAITMSIVRRARMGLEVEDALEAGMQQPKPQSDPKAAAEAAKQQQAAIAQQHDQAMERLRMAHDQQLAQRQQAHEEQMAQRQTVVEQQRVALETASRERELQMESAFKKQQAGIDASIAHFKALLDSITKIEVAEISANATISAGQESAAREAVQ